MSLRLPTAEKARERLFIIISYALARFAQDIMRRLLSRYQLLRWSRRRSFTPDIFSSNSINTAFIMRDSTTIKPCEQEIILLRLRLSLLISFQCLMSHQRFRPFSTIHEFQSDSTCIAPHLGAPRRMSSWAIPRLHMLMAVSHYIE